jgi:predicted nucleic acid-binding protein
VNRRPVFADTAFYVALADERDSLRLQALALDQLLENRRVVTSESVLLEVLNFFCARGNRSRTLALQMVRAVLADTTVSVQPAPTSLFQESLAFYESRMDKNYSLTDCISMLICRRLGIREIATTDHGFEQEGFEILLRSP